MRTWKRPVVAGVAALVSFSLLAGSASADTGADEMAFVAKLNQLRAAHGQPALATRGELFDTARAWSARMAAAGSISHNPDLAHQAPSNWARLGENVGVGMDVQSLHDAFVASPPHFRNMVDGAFDSVGVGVVRNAAGITYVTVAFMTSQPAPPQVVASSAGAAVKAKARTCRSRRTKACRPAQVRRARARR